MERSGTTTKYPLVHWKGRIGSGVCVAGSVQTFWKLTVNSRALSIDEIGLPRAEHSQQRMDKWNNSKVLFNRRTPWKNEKKQNNNVQFIFPNFSEFFLRSSPVHREKWKIWINRATYLNWGFKEITNGPSIIRINWWVIEEITCKDYVPVFQCRTSSKHLVSNFKKNNILSNYSLFSCAISWVCRQ